MKYSITAQPIKQAPFIPGKVFTKTFSNYKTSFSVCVDEDRKIRLQCYNREKCNGEQNRGVDRFEVQVEDDIEWNKLTYVWHGDKEWVLVLSQPLKLYYVLEKYQSVIPIDLPQTINIQETQCFVNYPDLFIYGHQPQQFANNIHCLNLTTFDFKEVKAGKDYSPKGRSHCWSFFSDSRLYVTGGMDGKGEQLDPLMWTFSIDNGYWFALDFVAQGIRFSEVNVNCEIENGKVLVVTKENVLVVQLYQSRAIELQGWRDLISPQQLAQVRGVYMDKEGIYFQMETAILPLALSITKQKEKQ